ALCQRLPALPGSDGFRAGSKKIRSQTMIALASDCLLFRLTSGESVPFSAEMISVELLGDTAKESDPDLIDEAAKAVFHYFKHDLERNSVTVGEFAMALEKVLSSLAQAERAAAERRPAQRVLESDLRRLALESGQGCELFFFPLLRRNCASSCGKPRAWCVFAGCAGRSSNWWAPAAGERAVTSWRSRLWAICGNAAARMETRGGS